MTAFSVTIIDVGWGDSILVETEEPQPDGSVQRHFGLIDCNDTTYQRSGYLFVKRHIEKREIDLSNCPFLFDFVLLTHGHADHASGLKRMMSEFRTDWFWYPKSGNAGTKRLLQYANRTKGNKVQRHQAIDRTHQLPAVGPDTLEPLWPPNVPGTDPYDDQDENNNSVVLLLTLSGKSLLLTGDCQAENWDDIQRDPRLPSAGLLAIQSPHHGAKNGMFKNNGDTPWLDGLSPQDTVVGLSSHISPHGHPHPDVVAELNARHFTHYRTDEHYHLTFTVEGNDLTVKWSH